MVIPAEIQDLVDRPAEALHVELKEWIDISAPVVRAKSARHLAALANHGGGYLIIGICDDGSLDSQHPGDFSAFTHDQVTGIVDRYLTPAFQCDVFIVSPAGGGGECVVVRIPSHGSVPICVKADGPHDERGRPQGIRKGEYYIRLPGPKSAPIDSPEQWRALIHRCVLNERQGLLESIARVLMPAERVPEQVGATLADWHDAMRKHIKELL